MNRPAAAFLVCVSAGIALARVLGETSVPFQYLAHLWVLLLLARYWIVRHDPTPEGRRVRRLAGGSALALSIVEAACFALSAKGQALIARLV